MNHFFTDPSLIQGMDIFIEGDDVNHIKNVLRLKPGEEISVSNGVDDKEYRCGIEEISDDRVRCRLRFVKETGVELPAAITLFQGLPKADKMELIIQKAVELGAAAVVPVACRRCVVQLDAKKYEKKRQRWQEIAEAAAKQSKRSVIPQVGRLMTMKEAIASAKEMDVSCIPYELAEGMENTRAFMNELKQAVGLASEGSKPDDPNPESPAIQPRAAIFIGPEGGFEEAEVEMAQEAGIMPVSLGRRILRTETAGMAMLSMIMYELEMKN